MLNCAFSADRIARCEDSRMAAESPFTPSPTCSNASIAQTRPFAGVRRRRVGACDCEGDLYRAWRRTERFKPGGARQYFRC